MASSSSTSINVKAPQLASASGAGGGMPHALWRPQMQTFLMQQSIEERHYTRAIAKWKELDVAVQGKAVEDDDDAIDVLLGIKSMESTPPVKTESSDSSSSSPVDAAVAAETKQKEKAKERVAELINKSRKAYGFLYSALPADLRQLIADVPQGYAYGIWSFLEKKFRSTEQDSVMAGWQRVTTFQPEDDEMFDEAKARLDAEVELLKIAGQTVPHGLYMSLLL